MGSSEAVFPDLGRVLLLPYAGPTLQEQNPPVQTHVSSELLCSHSLEEQPLHRNLYETMSVEIVSVIPDGATGCILVLCTHHHCTHAFMES